MILKLDYDTNWKLPLRELRRRARIAHVTILRCVDVRSPSGRGWHRVLEVERSGGQEETSSLTKTCQRNGGRSTRSLPFSALELVALQLLFGSDPIREAFNLQRARLVDARQVPPFWRRRWNTLYATSAGK